MKTLKTTLLISMLLILTTSCTDLTDNLVPETKTDNIEIISKPDTGDDDGNGSGKENRTNTKDTGDDDGNGSGKEN